MTEERMNDFEEVTATAQYLTDKVVELRDHTAKLFQEGRRMKDREVSTMLSNALLSTQEALQQLVLTTTEIRNAYEEEDNAPQIQL